MSTTPVMSVRERLMQRAAESRRMAVVEVVPPAPVKPVEIARPVITRDTPFPATKAAVIDLPRAVLMPKQRREPVAKAPAVWVMAPPATKLGVVIDRIVAARKLSMRQFAELVGIDHGSISRWRSGGRQATRDKLYQVADRLEDGYPLSQEERTALLESAGFLADWTP